MTSDEIKELFKALEVLEKYESCVQLDLNTEQFESIRERLEATYEFDLDYVTENFEVSLAIYTNKRNKLTE